MNKDCIMYKKSASGRESCSALKEEYWQCKGCKFFKSRTEWEATDAGYVRKDGRRK